MQYNKTFKATGEYPSWHKHNEKVIAVQKLSAKRELLNKIMKQIINIVSFGNLSLIKD